MAAAKSKAVSVSSPKLLIRLQKQPSAPVEWVEYTEGGGGEIQHLSMELLAELGTLPAAQSAHLLLSASMATCKTIVIPDEEYELTDQKLHWLADETLDEGAPSLHWTLLSRQGSRLTVAGIDAGWLASQLRTLADAGINTTCVTFDACCLPACDNGWTVLREGDRWLLRTQENYLSCLTEAWLTHLLTHFGPPQLVNYGSLPLACSTTESQPERHILTLYPNGNVPNLLHDKIRAPSPRSPTTALLKRVALFSIMLAAGVALLTRSITYWQLHSLEKQLSQDLVQQWQRYIPENRHSSNLRTYLPKQLQQHIPAPYLFLQQLQSKLSAFPGLALEGLNYDPASKSLQLFIYASDESQVQAFIKARIYGLPLKVEKHEQGMWTLRND